MKPITEVAQMLGLENLVPYGRYKAKIPLEEIWKREREGKVVLITSINPTPFGEGKTTTAIGLSEALWKVGRKSVVTLREPSLGPLFGVKGGGTGGGKAQVEPSEEINMHFTGDFHAIQTAHNLLASMLNNIIYHGNKPRIDRKKILWGRVLDINDRGLRNVIVGLGENSGALLEDHFEITAASEITAIMALAKNYKDMKERLSKILVAFTKEKKPFYAKDVSAEGAMAALLRDALLPNIVQTTEGTPAIVHIGPFANIAHGHNSLLADEVGLRYSDILVTEAGFGSDLGAEKFVNIVAREGNFDISTSVIVVTAKALKYQGGVKKKHVEEKNLEALEKGSANLLRHLEIVRKLGFEPVVAINKFPKDDESEINRIIDIVEDNGVKAFISEVFNKGGEGAIELAKEISKNGMHPPRFVYKRDDDIKEKIEKIASEIYGASGVDYDAKAKKDLKIIDELGFNDFLVCMAKTQYSLTDNPRKKGAPEDFVITIRNIKISAGARFVVPILGDISTMPGLPAVPAAQSVDLTDDGTIVGLR
ncbi:formate--tetrahydrofolate ligase [Euryarchaeota archaeon ex4484_178]|nr:MAG: formate--tetrahydrofolate ligase [Euryarchaeota archaeon ex4484_178]